MTSAPDLPALAQWLQQLRQGTVRNRMLIKPRYEPGERFGSWLNGIGQNRTPLDQVPLLYHGGERTGGICFATDRRVFLGSAGKVKAAWRWSEVADVRVAQLAAGVFLLPQQWPDDGACTALFKTGATIGWTGQLDAGALDQHWWKTQACFYASQGRLDEWWARVQAADPAL